MCDHSTFDTKANEVNPKAAPAADEHRCGSRRWRLWELPASAHCPVVGVCIPAELLRKNLRKVVDADLTMSDYDFHVGTVGHARCRNPISDALQKLLDRRFAQTIRRFQAAKTKDALATLWSDAIDDGDIAGPFWAALTHAQCTAKMQEALIRDMHLLQHQACAMFRANARDLEMLEQRNAALAANLGQAQDRHARQVAEKNELILAQQQQLIQCQGEMQASDQKIAALTSRLDGALAPVPERDCRRRQEQEISVLQHSQRQAGKRIRDLERQLQRQAAQFDSERAELLLRQRERPQPAGASDSESGTLRLGAENVLCVGGRAGNVPDYRQIIEKAGALFAYHDGGIEDSQSLLESGLAAADMVICQTGCISHNAYWRVKDFCKRTGKRCVYVDNPSTSSLIKGLKKVAFGVPEPALQSPV